MKIKSVLKGLVGDKMLGRYDYLLKPKLADSWGGGFQWPKLPPTHIPRPNQKSAGQCDCRNGHIPWNNDSILSKDWFASIHR